MSIEITDLEVAEYETAEQARVDWSVIENPDVAGAARSAAYSFARDYEGVVEREDMEQELLIAFAERANMVRQVLAEADNPAGVLNFRGYRLLRTKFRTHAAHRRQEVPFVDEVTEDGAA
ncbi:hypothetical protein [Streptomyces sp. NPDC002547]